MKTIIFTDMDGTLLNHHDYSFESAIPVLEQIKKESYPLILTTSKTRAEVLIWQQKLGINDPFIPENGAAIFFPNNYKGFNLDAYPLLDGFRVVSLGKPYPFVTTYLATILDKYEITGFAQMTPQELMEITGLTYEEALLSKKRDFSEPFLMKDDTLLPILQEEAKLYGLKITQGGRFYHCIGIGQDKGMAVRTTLAIFRRNGYDAKSIALGDGQNDEAMLQVVDTPIQLPSAEGSYVPMDIPHLIRSPHAGSKGWAMSLKECLSYVYPH